MIKALKVFVLVSILVGMAATSGMALTWTGTTRSVSYEMIDPVTGLPITNSITPVQYTVDAGEDVLINGFSLSFTLLKSTITNPGSMNLCKFDGAVDTTVTTVGTFSNSFVQFNVPAASVVAGDILYVAESCDANAAAPAIPTAPFNLVLDGSLTKGPTGNVASVRVVTNATSPSSTLATDDYYAVQRQFDAAVISDIADIVDINAGLLQFVTGDLFTTVPLASTLSYVDTVPDVGIVDQTGITVDFVFTGPMSGVDRITLRDAGGLLLGEAVPAGNTTTVTVSLVDALTVSYAQVDVTGTTPLAPRRITLADVITNKGTSVVMAKDTVSALDTAATAFTWTINGLMYKIPYLRNNDTVPVRTAVRIEASNGESADTFFFWGTDNAASEQVIPLTLTVPNGEAVVVTAADILTAAEAVGAPLNKTAEGFAGRLVFNAAPADPSFWHLYATQFVSGTYRDLPIFLCVGGICEDNTSSILGAP